MRENSTKSPSVSNEKSYGTHNDANTTPRFTNSNSSATGKRQMDNSECIEIANDTTSPTNGLDPAVPDTTDDGAVDGQGSTAGMDIEEGDNGQHETSKESVGLKNDENDDNGAPEELEVEDEDEDEDGDEDGEDAAGDGEDIEDDPLFDYSRVNHLPYTFFKKDAISCSLIGDKVHVFATHSGIVHMAKPDSTAIRTVRVHRASILDISYAEGYVATASIDGTIVISKVDDANDTTMASFKRPIHAVALHPEYASLKCYVSGGTAGQVVLSEKGWVKSRSDSVLYQGASTIVGLKWSHGGRAIWCDEDGIFIYDTNSQCIVQRVSRLPNSPRSDMFRPRICLSGDGSILVGWGFTVWSIQIQTGKTNSCFKASGVVSGIACFHSNNSEAVLLSVPSTQSSGGPPELKIVSLETGEEKYADELALAEFQKLGPNDYHLGAVSTEGPWYIISAADAVTARERTINDHVKWLASHGKLLEAYELSLNEETSFSDAERRELALNGVEQLVHSRSRLSFERAAQILRSVLPDESTAQWMHWSKTFIESGHIGPLGDVLPVEVDGLEQLRLTLINWAYQHDKKRLVEWISSWSISTYDTSAVVTLLDSSEDEQILSALAQLQISLDEPLAAVSSLVRAKSPMAFEIVRERHLWNMIPLSKFILSGIDSNNGKETAETEARIKSLVTVRNEIPATRVIEQLNGYDYLMYLYLKMLGTEDEHQAREFADLQVKLLAEFDRLHLLGYLERFDNYDLSSAIGICESRDYIRELVYLLGKVGKPAEALDLIINRLNDPATAIRFVKSHMESPELWEQLIAYAGTKPDVVLELLRCMDVSPVRVLSAVPKGMQIKGLRQALCSVFADERVNSRLAKGSLEIVVNESQVHMNRLSLLRNEGSIIDSDLDIDWSQPVVLDSNDVYNVDEGKQSEHSSAPDLKGKASHLGWILGNWGQLKLNRVKNTATL